MNILYIGVDNPLEITTANIPQKNLKVVMINGSIKHIKNNEYQVHVQRPGESIIVVKNGDEVLAKYHYWVKRIPNPIVILAKSTGHFESEFRAHGGLMTIMEDFDFNVQCTIESFTIQRISNGKITEIINNGKRYSEDAQKLIFKAQPNDIYRFKDIRVRCKDDVRSRKIKDIVHFVE